MEARVSDDSALMDFSQPRVRRMVCDYIKTLTGIYRFECVRVRNQRSLQANAFYWSVILKAVQRGISEAWGENLSIDEIHLMMREKFLSKPICNRATGELMHTTAGSTAALDKIQFADYLDKIIKFAAEYLNVEVPAADPCYANQGPIPSTPNKPEDF